MMIWSCPYGGLLVRVAGDAILDALPLVLGLHLGERTEPSVSVCFQRIRHEAMLRIDAKVTPLREVGLIPRALDLLLPQVIGGVELRLQFLLHCEGHLHRDRRQPMRGNKEIGGLERSRKCAHRIPAAPTMQI